MKKIIIFGAGPTGKRAYAFYREFCDVVAYADNNEAIQETSYRHRIYLTYMKTIHHV